MGTVKGDMHDIGKNLVGIMLQGAGFDIIDLGLNVLPQKFIEAIKTAGLRSNVQVIIGGVPVSQKFTMR